MTASHVAWNPLPEPDAIEAAWRRVYDRAFRSRPRVKHGVRADYEYQKQSCDHYLVVKFSAGVDGLPVHVLDRRTWAYECRGPLVPLGKFCDEEFFVSPTDLSWSMIHTHEDHALGGPYFIRAEWLPGGGSPSPQRIEDF